MKSKLWEHKDTIVASYATRSGYVLAKEYGVSAPAMLSFLRKNGVLIRPRGHITRTKQAIREQFGEAIMNTVGYSEIAVLKKEIAAKCKINIITARKYYRKIKKELVKKAIMNADIICVSQTPMESD